MEIIGTSQEEKNRKTKKIMLWITIAIIILFIVSIILFITIYYLTGQLFKFYVNDNKISNMEKDLFIYEGEDVYISLEDIAPIIGYKFYNSSYDDKYREDTDKCYLQSENEVVTFEKGEDIIYKTPNSNIDYAYYKIDKPIKGENNKLYISAKGLEKACNLSFVYEQNKNTITIRTLQYYVDYFMQNNIYASVSSNFNNQKALMYGFLVTQDVANTERNATPAHYGISNLSGNKIVGEKYTSIEFIEATEEFIVKTDENKVGIITSTGETKVDPLYDSLKQIDKDLNLYLATVGNKQGVIEKYGKILIHPEYEKIGIDLKDFSTNEIKNPYVLFNNVIPVEQNGNWGLYDIRGNIILPLQYSGIGCTNVPSGANNVAIVPILKVITVAKDYEIDDGRGRTTKLTLYGIVNYLGKEVIPAGLQSVYSTVTNGRTEYRMKDYTSGSEYNLIEWIAKNRNINELNEEETTKQVEIENTNTNTVVNEVRANTTVNETTTNTTN